MQELQVSNDSGRQFIWRMFSEREAKCECKTILHIKERSMDNNMVIKILLERRLLKSFTLIQF